MVLPIQKQMMTNKLTNFVIECDNDEALTYFLKNVYQAKLAHSSIDNISKAKCVLVIFDTKSIVYKPKDLIEELLSDESRIDSIRNTVHYIKDNIDYKKHFNHFDNI